MLQFDEETRLDKTGRAKAALKQYVEDSEVDRPRPDGEMDEKLNKLLDNLAANVIELAAWFSESAMWTSWASKGKPPRWAIPYLNEAELAGLGLTSEMLKPMEKDPIPELIAQGKKGSKGKKKGEPIKLMTSEQLQYMIDHYDELPTIDPETGGPIGEVY